MKSISLKYLCFVSFLISTILPLYGQLEIVPSPLIAEDGLGNFKGGADGDLFFSYIGIFDSYFYHYDGNSFSDLNLGLDGGESVVARYDGYTYLSVPDFINTTVNYYKYNNDGNSLEGQVSPPLGYSEVGNYITTFNDLMYFRQLDFNTWESNLFQFNGNSFTLVQNPSDLLYEKILGTSDDKMLITYKNQGDSVLLYSFDGNVLSPITDIPLNTQNITLVYQEMETLYLDIEDDNFMNTLYKFDGISTIEVVSPIDSDFVTITGSNSITDELYIIYENNLNNESSAYIYDGSTLSPMIIPIGFSFSSMINEFNGISYVTLLDDISSTEALFKLEGGVFEEVTIPDNYTFNAYIDDFSGKPYYELSNASSVLFLSQLDPNTNTLTIIPGPTGNFEYRKYYTTFDEQMFFSFKGDLVFGFYPGYSLFMFDGVNFFEIAPDVEPDEISVSGGVLVEDQDILYLSYTVENPNLSGRRSLYKLFSTNLLPSSEDIELMTFINTPYFFSETDFTFLDANIEDTLHSIIITEIDEIGNLLLSGQNIEAGDTILVGDIENMSFIPPLDELGTFVIQYRVGDGSSFSEENNLLEFSVISAPNSLPTSEDNIVTTFVNIPYTFETSDFAFADTDLGDTLHSILITSLNQSGVLLLDSENVELGDTVSVGSLTSLIFVPPLDEAITTSFQFKVGDGKGFSEESNLMELSVISIPNSLPTSEDNIVTTFVNIPYTFENSDFAFTDTDLGDTLHSVLITSLNQSGVFLLDSENVELGDTVSVGSLTSLIFVPPLDEAGTTSFQFKVGDGKGFSEESNLMELSVISIPNSLPTSEDNIVTTFVNIPYTFENSDFAFTDTDLGDTLHSVLITSLNQSGVFLLDSENVELGDTVSVGSLTSLIFVPPLDEAVTTSFQFKVGDGKGFSEESNLMEIITVQDSSISVYDNEFNALINVYPVPITEIVNLQIEATQPIGKLTLRIFNNNGKIFFEKEYLGLDNNFITKLELDNFATGNYLLIGYTDKGQFRRSLVIVN